MPLLYLAKVNLNSNIFDVYNKILDIKDVSKHILTKFSSNDTFINITKEKYLDSLGNQNIYFKKSTYSFQEIEKNDEGIITGKLVRSFEKPSEKLDIKTNKMVTSSVEESVSIFFYFDVYKEMITFCERQSFGYNQFMIAFTQLLNKCTIPYEFEIFLQKDEDILEEKLKSLTSVTKIRATLIPPNNSNEDNLNLLSDERRYTSQFSDPNATKIEISYFSSDMNMESQIMKDIKKAVSSGYGDVNATGTNSNGRVQTVKSSQDAAYTAHIQEKINENDFKDESRNLILRFLSKRITKLSHRTEM